MGLWRDLLRLFGLSSDARVHISAPGIDVVITGEPRQVRLLLEVVKYELERSVRWRESPEPAKRPAIAPGPSTKPRSAAHSSQLVLPTELDEMDSPYALPEALVIGVDTTGERNPMQDSTDEIDADGRRWRTEGVPAGQGGPLAAAFAKPAFELGSTQIDPEIPQEHDPEATDVVAARSPSRTNLQAPLLRTLAPLEAEPLPIASSITAADAPREPSRTDPSVHDPSSDDDYGTDVPKT